MRCEAHQITAVVERHRFHVLGKHVLVELLGLGLDGLENDLGLLPAPHQHDAFDGVVLVHESKLAESRRVPNLNSRDVLDEHRDVVLHGDDDVADVLERHDPAEAAHVEELTALGVEAAARVGVVGAQRR